MLSTPRKKTASRLVMITTIRPVINVSRRVGQTIFADSVRTSRRNLPGLNAMFACHALSCSGQGPAAAPSRVGAPSPLSDWDGYLAAKPPGYKTSGLSPESARNLVCRPAGGGADRSAQRRLIDGH